VLTLAYAAPTITSVIPLTGTPTAGGTLLEIDGQFFVLCFFSFFFSFLFSFVFNLFLFFLFFYVLVPVFYALMLLRTHTHIPLLPGPACTSLRAS
jgi:hypothetical protein